ncbi:MAG TPA: glycosyltransferase family 4 protein [Pyrinomonadaceae bacterium]|nr:glycosyltransferase family 4 protein [Pyrinomonadaceae bacterium]
MKIVLLTLSGNPDLALERLAAQFPGAAVESLARAEFEKGSAAARTSALRRRQPEVFAVATERLVWQRGQDAFLLLGALAGARQSILLDMHNGWRKESKADALLRAPIRLARDFATSYAALRRADSELRKLEVAVERGEHRPQVSGPDGKRPKIAYVRSSPGPGTQAGGAASHINGFVNAALQLGVRVSLISNDEIAGLDQRRVPMKIIWPKPVGSTRAAFDIYNNLHFTERVLSEIQNEEPDFIYQRYARFSWAGVAAAVRAKRPLFLEYNGSEVWVGRHWDRVDKLDLLARYERLNLKAAARIFVVSEVERQNLLKAGIEREKIIVNPNGVDVDKFKPGVGGDEARRELGLTPDEIVVGFVGTFGPWHGVEVLAQAITQIPADSALRFLLIGSGALRARVEEILREAGVADRVLMPGAVAHDRVPSLLDACDILVSPHVPLDAGAEFFGSPTKLFEYMAMGKGIVASRLGQIGDVLQHEKTALLVEPGNIEQLTGAIVRLTTSPEMRERLGAAARRTAVEHHTWKHNAQRVLNEYASL